MHIHIYIWKSTGEWVNQWVNQPNSVSCFWLGCPGAFILSDMLVLAKQRLEKPLQTLQLLVALLSRDYRIDLPKQARASTIKLKKNVEELEYCFPPDLTVRSHYERRTGFIPSPAT